jgi:hypothetical protein
MKVAGRTTGGGAVAQPAMASIETPRANPFKAREMVMVSGSGTRLESC